MSMGNNSLLPALFSLGGAAAGSAFGPLGTMGGSMLGGMAGNGMNSLTGGGQGGTASSMMNAASMMNPGMMDPTMIAAGMDPTGMTDPNSMMGGNPMSANAGPAMSGTGGSGGGAGSSPGIMNALFSSGSSGAPSAQTLIAQGMDPYQAYQLQALNQQQNPSLFNQSMGAMGPVGTQLLQARQAQQLQAMKNQAPTANLQGGANPVPGSFGTASSNPSTMSMPQQYVQMLAMLGR